MARNMDTSLDTFLHKDSNDKMYRDDGIIRCSIPCAILNEQFKFYFDEINILSTEKNYR